MKVKKFSKYSSLIKSIQRILKNKEYLEIYQTSKATIILLECRGKKYFLKSKKEIQNFDNYDRIKKYYRVPKFFGTFGDYMIFEYIEDFGNRTIHDYLYHSLDNTIDFNSIALVFHKSINHTLTLMNEKDTESKKFFYNRIPKLEKYLSNIKMDTIIFHHHDYSISKIINQIKTVLEQDKKVYAFLSQGDPTDTNITITGYLTDFENAGYNTILSELSIIFVSLFSHGRYFYPKYNPNTYIMNPEILSKYKNYQISIEYEISEDKIEVHHIDLKLPNKNKELILNFIDIYLTNKNYSKYKNDLFLLKYYIGMRILTPIDIDNMEEKDKIIILVLLILIDINITDLNSLREWIGRC